MPRQGDYEPLTNITSTDTPEGTPTHTPNKAAHRQSYIPPESLPNILRPGSALPPSASLGSHSHQPQSSIGGSASSLGRASYISPPSPNLRASSSYTNLSEFGAMQNPQNGYASPQQQQQQQQGSYRMETPASLQAGHLSHQHSFSSGSHVAHHVRQNTGLMNASPDVSAAVANFYQFFRDVLATPSQYGFGDRSAQFLESRSQFLDAQRAAKDGCDWLDEEQDDTQPYFFYDSCHPTAHAKVVMANYALKVVQEAFPDCAPAIQQVKERRSRWSSFVVPAGLEGVYY